MTSDMIIRFNRDTRWLATGLLSTLVFAALVLAVQELNPRKPNPTKEGVQAGSELSLNANPAPPSLNGMSSTDKTTSGQSSIVDHALTEISPHENPSSKAATIASTPTPVLAFHQTFERVIPPNVSRARSRSSVRSRILNVKRRLIALWHKSLMRSAKSQIWPAFSNLNGWVSKKAAYAAESNR